MRRSGDPLMPARAGLHVILTRLLIPLSAALIPTPSRAATSTSLLVPAAQDLPGVDTGVEIIAGQSLQITATGLATYGLDYACGTLGYPLTDPTGLRYVNGVPCAPKIDPSATLPTAPIGALLSRIGSGPWFYVGTSFSSTPTLGGRLYHIYNDVPGEYGNNSGSYNAFITTGAPPGWPQGAPSGQVRQQISFEPVALDWTPVDPLFPQTSPVDMLLHVRVTNKGTDPIHDFVLTARWNTYSGPKPPAGQLIQDGKGTLMPGESWIGGVRLDTHLLFPLAAGQRVQASVGLTPATFVPGVLGGWVLGIGGDIADAELTFVAP